MFPFLSSFLILILLLAVECSEIKVIAVEVKDAKILHPIKNFKDTNVTDYHWPVLYLELDIGKICFSTEGQGHSRPYMLALHQNPECTGLICPGPPGPAVESWTRRVFTKYLSSCVYNGYGLEQIMADNFTKVPLPSSGGPKIIGMEANITEPPQLLVITDPEQRLERVLTPEANMVVQITERDLIQNTRLLVTTPSFLRKDGRETSFCWFHKSLPAEWLLGQEQDEKERLGGRCTYFCGYGMLKGEAWEWGQADLIDELFNCLGKNFYFNGMAPFLVERDHKLEKIRLGPRKEEGGGKVGGNVEKTIKTVKKMEL